MTVSWTCLSSRPGQHIAEAAPQMRDHTVALPVTRDDRRPVGSLYSVATILTRSRKTFRRRFRVLPLVRAAMYLVMLHLAIFERQPRCVRMEKSMIIAGQAMCVEDMSSVLGLGPN